MAAEVRKIAILGPESSGKTTLAHALAARGSTWCVEEYARIHLEKLERSYVEEDLLDIARAQAGQEDIIASLPVKVPLMVCDTEMITMRIWSEEKFGRCHPWIIEQSKYRPYDLFLLCAPDIPWVADPLRENPHDRDRLFEVYMRMLDALKKPYVIISGDREKRVNAAAEAILSSSD